MISAVRLALRILGALVVTPCLALAFAVYAVLLRRSKHARAFGHFGMRAMKPLFGLRILVDGRVPETRTGAELADGRAPDAGTSGRLVVANHRTGLDVIALETLLDARVLAHAGVGTWPLIGRMARAMGTIFVNRAGGGSRAAALRGIEAALSSGDTVLVFPEGTTFGGDEVHRFSKGVFTAARGHEILPLGLAVTPGAEFTEDAFGAHIWRLLHQRRTVFAVAIGEPYTCPDDAAHAAEDARFRVDALVRRARRAYDEQSER